MVILVVKGQHSSELLSFAISAQRSHAAAARHNQPLPHPPSSCKSTSDALQHERGKSFVSQQGATLPLSTPGSALLHAGKREPHLLSAGGGKREHRGCARPRQRPSDAALRGPAPRTCAEYQVRHARRGSRDRNWEQSSALCSAGLQLTFPHRATRTVKMTENRRQEQPKWTTTVIMSAGLQNHEISTILQRQQHRVRYSESVEMGSVIFSLSGVAFILSDTQDFLVRGEEQFLERIQKFINIHRNSFLVLSAALHGPQEWNVMFKIQRRFLGSNLHIIPVHNTAETVKLMLTIAKMNSKPCADDISHKMAMTKTHIIENSPVWKMLQEYQQLHSN
ncbi:protein SPO16 homolog [Cyrtonyx montezumae]|uniref:protein SPO16 homolog n=1 Tax=Cyrtonyx montezumae TaxID=9017 RepID=UPI0032DA4432